MLIEWCGDRKGRCREQPATRQQPGHRVQLRRLERLARASARGRIDGRRRASIVLPGAGRADQQQVVPARRRDLQRPPRLVLPANVGEVDAGACHAGVAADLDRWARATCRGGTDTTCSSARHGDDAEAVDLRRLDGVGLGDDDGRRAGLRRPRSRRRARPGVGSTSPFSDSSPKNTAPSSGCGRHLRGGEPARSTAIGRSRPAPSLRRLPGARLTTTRRSGHSSPACSTAGRMRSRASATAAPGSPVSVSAGRPRPTNASTVTGWPPTPITVIPRTRPYMRATLAAAAGSNRDGSSRVPA